MTGIETIIEGIKKMYAEANHMAETSKAQRMSDALLSFHPQASAELSEIRHKRAIEINTKELNQSEKRAYKPIDYSRLNEPGYSPWGVNKKEIKINKEIVINQNQKNEETQKNSLISDDFFATAVASKDQDELLEAFGNDTSAIKAFINMHARTNIRNATPIGLYKLWVQNLEPIKEGYARYIQKEKEKNQKNE